jgi:hypothetical protein
MSVFIGIDVAKATLAVAVRPGDAQFEVAMMPPGTSSCGRGCKPCQCSASCWRPQADTNVP